MTSPFLVVGLILLGMYGIYCVAFFLAVLYTCVAERWCASLGERLCASLGERRTRLRREIEMRQFRSNNERRYVRVVAHTPRAEWGRLHRTRGSPLAADSRRCEHP